MRKQYQKDLHIDNKEDFYMQKALHQANKALEKGEVPIGAIVVDENGNVIAQSYNKIEKKGCQLAHAEALAIEKVCKKRGNWRLNDCTVYVTLEPCLMCFGLMLLSRVKKIVYGAKSSLFGVSLYQGVFGKQCVSDLAKKIQISGGVKEKQSIEILQRFFSQLRQKRKAYSEAKIRSSEKN